MQDAVAQSSPFPFIRELAMAQDREACRDFCWPGRSFAPSNRRDPHIRQRKHFLGASEAPSGYKAVPKADMVPTRPGSPGYSGKPWLL